MAINIITRDTEKTVIKKEVRKLFKLANYTRYVWMSPYIGTQE